MAKIEIRGIEIEVQSHTMQKLQNGPLKTIAGWARFRLPDGRTIEAAGRWDDPYTQDDEHPASYMETIEIDGQPLKAPDEIDEQGTQIIVGEDCIYAEEVASEILR